MTREPFKLTAFGALLATIDTHEPGDGTPCESTHCPDGTIGYPAVKRRVRSEWWDEQTRATERRIQAAQDRIEAHQEQDGLSLADNNWRRRQSNVLRDLERTKRHRADVRELEAARARLAWLQAHRP